MSVFAGPEISNTGLVFAYDMANTSKSWKGAPTSNLFSDPLNLTSSWVGNQGGGLGAKDSTDTILAPDGISVAYRFYGANGGSTWTQNVTGLTVGATYSISCYVYPMGWTPYFYSPANVTYGAVTYSDVSGYPGWKRMFTTLTTTASNPYIGVHVGWSPGTLYAYYWGIQLELGSVVSSLVNGTRSNTQAIIDLTGQNTITATSLTYASDNTFSFNASSFNYVVAANNPTLQFLGTAAYTLEAWVYPTVNPGANNWTGIFNREWNDGLGRDGYNMYLLGSAGTTVQFTTERFTTGTGTNAYVTLEQTVALNAWNHIVAVYNGSTLSLYCNGTLGLSNASTGNVTNTTTSLNVGRRDVNYFTGKIAVSKIYGRALSATEVQQNFEALRSRFGI